MLLPQCPSLVNYYGSSPNHPTVINFLLAAQRNCGTRRIQQNPLVCCIDPYYGPQQYTTVQPTYQPIVQSTQPPIYQPTTRATVQPFTAPVTPPVTETTPAQPIQPITEVEIPPATTTSAPIVNEKLCQDPNGIHGVCKSLKECPSVLNEFLVRNKDTAYVQYIKQSNEKCRKIQPFICCPTEEPTSTVPPVQTTVRTTSKPLGPQGRLLLPSEGCGFTKVKTTKIVGGQTAKIG